jgi:putative transcriptional regulator
MYMEGMSATVEVAVRLEEFLGESLVLPVDPFAYTRETGEVLRSFEAFESFERNVFRKLQSLGYSVLPTVKCPFDALTTRDTLFLTAVPTKGERIADKARVVSNISAVVERDAVLFVEVHTSTQSIDGTPLIQKSELRRIRDRDEIEDLIAERRK